MGGWWTTCCKWNFEATPEQILVNGELIVHRDDIITEQDILAHINLIDQLSAEVIDTPSTATISDSLTAKVEVTLLDGSKVIVNVPVKVVEKELSVVKQQAIESIENAAQQKINEINNSVTLTLEQKKLQLQKLISLNNKQLIMLTMHLMFIQLKKFNNKNKRILNNLIQNNLRLNKQNQMQLNRLKMQFNIWLMKSKLVLI